MGKSKRRDKERDKENVLTIRIPEAAKNDLIIGYRFYERQALGLGDYFLERLFSDIDSLSSYAGIHPKKFGGYHCMFSGVFPFAIYYLFEKKIITIYAVLDCRQNPDHMIERLRHLKKS